MFDEQLQPVSGAKALLEKITVPMCVVSNGTVGKMQHSLGLTDMLSFFDDRLYSGYAISSWKPDPALMFHAAKEMSVPLDQCILVDDPEAGAEAGHRIRAVNVVSTVLAGATLSPCQPYPIAPSVSSLPCFFGNRNSVAKISSR